MEKLQITKMTPLLKNEICLWDRFSTENIDGYKNIQKYICFNGLKRYFQLHDSNSFLYNNAFNYVLKGEKGKILGFLCCRFDKFNREKSLFIQSIVVHPYEQKKGYAKEFLKMILLNPEKFIGVVPDKVSASIEPSNKASKNLFKSLGDDYYFEKNELFEDIIIDYQSIVRKQEKQ